jgi:beta-lactam-binding protein with PASTA domain
MTDDKTPPDSWPTPEGPTLVTEHETVVAPAPPPPAVPVDPLVPPPAGPPPDRRIGAGMLLALGAIALVALGVLLAWLLIHRGSSSPQQTGTTVVITTTAPPTSTAAVAPAPSTARKAVPDLKGLKLADAQSRLSSLGLKSTTTPVTSAAQPAGTVIDQAPKVGAKVAKGATVTLSVVKAPAGAATTPATTTGQTTTTTASTTTTGATTTAPTTTPSQPQTATVPDVQGQTEAAAAQALGQAGILPSITFVPGTDPLGTVLEQAKSSGTTVAYHAHVQINISRGPNNNPLEQVPDVVGKTLQDAVSALQGAQLRLIYLKFPVTSRAQAGKIVQQSPLGGQAPQNAQVLVFLGAYRAG